MKSLFLFGTKLRMYWVILPIALLLAICIRYNSESDALLMLFPLITVLILGIIFIFIYYFRAVRISYDEIRHVGLFSGRDSAIINEGKTLILKRLGGNRLQITLFGNDGILPELDWLKSTGDAPRDISLFRGKVIFYKRSAVKIMQYFGLTATECNQILAGELCEIKTELSFVTRDTENGDIYIRIDKTI